MIQSIIITTTTTACLFSVVCHGFTPTVSLPAQQQQYPHAHCHHHHHQQQQQQRSWISSWSQENTLTQLLAATEEEVGETSNAVNDDNNESSSSSSSSFDSYSITNPLQKLAYRDVVIGDGETIQNGKVITVAYEGRLLSNGKQFDFGKGYAFRLGDQRVIPGWEVGLQVSELCATWNVCVCACAGGDGGNVDTVPLFVYNNPAIDGILS